MKARNLAGQRFGRLVAIEDAGGPCKHRSRPWTCRCDCGRIVVRSLQSLTTGNTQSCGCLRVDIRMERRRRASSKGGRASALKRAPHA